MSAKYCMFLRVNAHFGGQVIGRVCKQGHAVPSHRFSNGMEFILQIRSVPLTTLGDHMPYFQTAPRSAIFRNGCLLAC